VTKLTQWFNANKLSLNSAKSEFIVFGPKNLVIDLDLLKVKVEENFLSKIEHVKFLGIHINEHLDWSMHFNTLISKISKGIYLLNSVKKFLPSHALCKLYYSMIYSYMNYGMLIWGSNLKQAQKNRLFKLQKKCVRIIGKAYYNDPSSALFKKFKILKLEDIIDLEILKFVFKYIDSTLPNSLMETYKRNCMMHNYDTRNRNNPRSHGAKSALVKNSFLGLGPSKWNDIKDTKLTKCKNISSFVNCFKKITLEKY